MDGEQEIVTEHSEVTTTTAPAPPDGDGATGVSETASVAAAQGAVAVAAEAVALADTATAASQIAAAETVAIAEADFARRLGDVETWRGTHEAAITTLAERVNQLAEQNSSILAALQEAATKSQSTETVPTSELSPDDNVVVENPEPKRRHRWI